MKSVLLFLGTVAAALMLLAPVKAGDCRHASANFAVHASYGHSALFSTYYAPSVQLRAVGDCYAPVPVDPVPVPVPLPPLALSADTSGSSYYVGSRAFFLHDTATYSYGNAANAERELALRIAAERLARQRERDRLALERELRIQAELHAQHGGARRADVRPANSGVVGVARAVANTARNIVGAVIGR